MQRGQKRKKAGLGWILLLALPVIWILGGQEKSPPTQPPPSPLPAAAASPVRDAPAPVVPVAGAFTGLDTPGRFPPTLSQHETGGEAVEEHGIFHARVRANMRARPSTSAPIVTRLEKGTTLLATRRLGNWHQVRSGSAQGWVRADMLSATPVASGAATPMPAFSSTAPPQGSGRQGSRPARQSAGQKSGPVRGAYKGRCECPYDIMRNGHRCGGRSAYSRLGGHKPKCFH